MPALRLYYGACEEIYNAGCGEHDGPQVLSVTHGNNMRVRVEYDRDIVCHTSATDAKTWEVSDVLQKLDLKYMFLSE